MRRYLELALILAVVALLALSLREPPTPEVPAGLALDGIHPGMAKSRVLKLLGPPASQGPLKVGNPPQEGSYMEWGTTGGLTWEGRPSVTFWPNGRVLAVIGDRVTLDGHPVFQRGEEPPDLAPGQSELGEQKMDEPDHATFHNADGDLSLTLEHSTRKVTRIVWSDPGTRPTLNGLKPGDRVEDALDLLGPPDISSAGFASWKHPFVQFRHDKGRLTLVDGMSGTVLRTKEGEVKEGDLQEKVDELLGAPDTGGVLQSNDDPWRYHDGIEVTFNGQKRVYLFRLKKP